MTEETEGGFEPARKMIYWAIAAVVITIVVIAFTLIIANYKSTLTKVPPKLRAELIALRFVNAPGCFAYQDEITGRIYPGVIDLSKFNEETMNKCYQSESIKNFNFQLVLDDKTLETDEWKHVTDFTLFKEVLVKEREELKPVILKIYVQERI